MIFWRTEPIKKCYKLIFECVWPKTPFWDEQDPRCECVEATEKWVKEGSQWKLLKTKKIEIII